MKEGRGKKKKKKKEGERRGNKGKPRRHGGEILNEQILHHRSRVRMPDGSSALGTRR